MEPTPQTIAHAIAPTIDGSLAATPELDEPATLFTTKFTPGGEPAITAPLWFVLLEPHQSDAHFTMYASDMEVRCIKSNAHTYQLRFSVAVFDLDYAGHKTRPGQQEFTDLLRLLWVVTDPTPNLVYPTRGGARILYHIDPLTDPVEFEDRLKTLMGLLQQQLSHSPYQLDPACRDWTRLFRAPRVVRDGVTYHDTPVHQIHNGVMDMRVFKRATRPERAKPLTGDAKFTGQDPWIAARMKLIREGSRNNTLYSLFCYIRDKYAPTEQEPWIAILEQKALAEGMEEREFWRTYSSAFGNQSL